MDENIIEQIRIERLQKIHGFRFIAVGINKLMTGLGRALYKRGYLSEIAETDSLTGLNNRNFFDRWSSVVVSQAERADVPICFVMIDLDRLKITNDKMGHKAGDRLIKRMAKSLLRHTRKSDVVVRMGGDEFVLILWNCGLEEASRIMNKQQVRMKKKDIYFSFGLVEWKKGRSVADVMKEADELMYVMKYKRKS